MQREQYLKGPGNEKGYGNFKKEKRSLWPDQVGTKNGKKKFISFKQGMAYHTAFSDILFWCTM